MKWIVSPKYDLTFFIGSVFVSLLFYGVFQFIRATYAIDPWSLALILYIVFVTFFDQPHIFQTFSRIWADKKEFQKRKFLYTWGLVLTIVAGFAIIYFDWVQIWIQIFALFGYYHIMMQNKGFIKAYKAINKDFAKFDEYLDVWAYYVVFLLLAVLYFQNELLLGFIPVPQWLIHIGYGLIALYVITFGVRQIVVKQINMPKVLLITATLITSYIIHSDPTLPLIMIVVLQTAYHDIQYQGWIAHYQKTYFPKVKYIALKWLGVSLLYGIIAGSLELLSLLNGGLLEYAVMPFTMIVLYHYYVDGLIWKFSEDKQLKTLLPN